MAKSARMIWERPCDRVTVFPPWLRSLTVSLLTLVAGCLSAHAQIYRIPREIIPLLDGINTSHDIAPVLAKVWVQFCQGKSYPAYKWKIDCASEASLQDLLFYSYVNTMTRLNESRAKVYDDWSNWKPLDQWANYHIDYTDRSSGRIVARDYILFASINKNASALENNFDGTLRTDQEGAFGIEYELKLSCDLQKSDIRFVSLTDFMLDLANRLAFAGAGTPERTQLFEKLRSDLNAQVPEKFFIKGLYGGTNFVIAPVGAGDDINKFRSPGGWLTRNGELLVFDETQRSTIVSALGYFFDACQAKASPP